jgi:hypothetical protein
MRDVGVLGTSISILLAIGMFVWIAWYQCIRISPEEKVENNELWKCPKCKVILRWGDKWGFVRMEHDGIPWCPKCMFSLMKNNIGRMRKYSRRNSA